MQPDIRRDRGSRDPAAGTRRHLDYLGTSSRERVRSTTASNTCCMSRPVGEDQVAAVLELIDGETVTKSAAVLLVEVKPEAQARGIDPPPTDLAQPPYSRILRQGICDPSQARGVGDRR